jgi:hypothetical protein
MWPQWTVLGLLVLGLGLALGKHGQSRKPFSFWETLINTAITFGLLYFGGFFKSIF